MVYEEPRAPRLYDDSDLPWIAQLLDVVEGSLGEPWRVLVERVEYAPLRAHRARRMAVLAALRRVLGGSGQRARIARRARQLVLGPPALDAAERTTRLATAAAMLGTTPDDVESLLWVDLAMERPVVLPEGRPAETELAAFANLDQIQRCVRRAHDLQLRVWDRANELVRTVARYGLISQIRRDGEATVLEVMGPLALFHSTIVYGRALSALVPLLADQPRFALDIHCRISGERARLRVAPPVWLPPTGQAPRRAPSPAERLASDLESLGRAVEREPPPIASGDHLLFPDLALDHAGARWLLEVLGFATQDYLSTKLARYRAAGVERVVLCADLATAPGCDLTPGVCGFSRRVDVDDLLATLEAAP
jgi:predicted nuclease of restriction endonuclease-like RecB superfamily